MEKPMTFKISNTGVYDHIECSDRSWMGEMLTVEHQAYQRAVEALKAMANMNSQMGEAPEHLAREALRELGELE
jgi:hypothetical protein